MTGPGAKPPPVLLVAAVLLGLQGLALAVLAALELVDLHADRVTLAITTALFFLLLAAGLAWCAWGLARVRSWARGPVMAADLIGVLVAFSFWGGATTPAAVAILVVCAATLLALLHPASTRALAADEG